MSTPAAAPARPSSASSPTGRCCGSPPSSSRRIPRAWAVAGGAGALPLRTHRRLETRLAPVLHAGGCVVLLPGFDPGAVLDAVARYRINHFGAVEAMLTAIAEHPAFGSTDLASLRGDHHRRAPWQRCHHGPASAGRGTAVGQSRYGQDRGRGPSNFIHLAREGDPEALARSTPRASGPRSCTVTHRIVDAHGADAADGSAGELWLRSPHSFDGYVGDPEAYRPRAR
ncbi:MAG: AMP-binding protein [Arhodomonas sp.]|nr:AMP-binding protein [Arhodomonas sp.]